MTSRPESGGLNFGTCASPECDRDSPATSAPPAGKIRVEAASHFLLVMPSMFVLLVIDLRRGAALSVRAAPQAALAYGFWLVSPTVAISHRSIIAWSSWTTLWQCIG